jgi:predicted transcriptional regulator YdeE
MDVKIIEIEEDILIGGFSIESTGENFNKDMEILYNDFIHNGKMGFLNNISKNKHEYYEVTWYHSDKEGFKWLLGQKIINTADNLETKIIKKGKYAVAKFPPKYDKIKAWEDLWSEGIPGIGYTPIEENDENIAFMYYPNGLDGENEIWALVKKA